MTDKAAAQDAPHLIRHKYPEIPALTGMRFFAAFSILIAHSSDWLGQFQDTDIGRSLGFMAMYGMPMFFVLSGFVIHYNYGSLFSTQKPVRAAVEFIAARAARLLPLYFFLLAFALLADDFFQKRLSDPSYYYQILFHDLTLTQSWWFLAPDGTHIINHLFPLSWSISTEWFFYIAYIPAVYFLSTLRGPAFSLLALILLVCFAYALSTFVRVNLPDLLAVAQNHVDGYVSHTVDNRNSFHRWLFYFSPYARIFEFLTGALVAQFVMSLNNRPVGTRERRLADVLIIAALIALVLAGAVHSGWLQAGPLTAQIHFLGLNYLCAPPLALIIFCLARYRTWLSDFLSLTPLILLGEMSYSIYLVHTWTLQWLQHAPQPFTLLWAIDAAGRIAIGIAMTFIVSFATYTLVEMPARRRLRRVFAGWIAWGFGARHEGGAPAAMGLGSRLSLASFGALAIAMVVVGGQLAEDRDVRFFVRSVVTGEQGAVRVLEATYGLNCAGDVPGAPSGYPVAVGNVTLPLARACNGRVTCDYAVDVAVLRDPAPQCPKDFSVSYACSAELQRVARLAPEAHGHEIRLDCSAGLPP